MRIFSAVLLFITFSSAQAKFEEGYYTKANLPKAPKNLDRALEASVHLMDMVSWGSCSASVVSPDGYVLTAAHCVTEILNVIGWAEEKKEKGGANYTEVFKQKPGIISKALSLDDLKLDSPKFSLVGKGYAEFDDRLVLDIPEDFFKKQMLVQDDYAILKFAVDPNKPLKCIPVAAQPDLAPGEGIWAVGFPAATKRSKPEISSDGKTEYISYGSVISSVEENDFFKKQNMTPTQMSRLKEFYDLPQHLLSDMDIFSGNSGSMAINSDGELVGVNIAGAVPADTDANGYQKSLAQDTYYKNSTISLRMSTIIKAVETHMGAGMAKKVFSCPR